MKTLGVWLVCLILMIGCGKIAEKFHADQLLIGYISGVIVGSIWTPWMFLRKSIKL